MTANVAPKYPHTNIEDQFKSLNDAHTRLDVIVRQLIAGLKPVVNPAPAPQDCGAAPSDQAPAAVLSPLGESLRGHTRFVEGVAAQLEALYDTLEI